MTRRLTCHMALLLSALALVGCTDVVRKLIDVPEPDIFLVPLVDAGANDTDGANAAVLSLLNVEPDHGSFAGGTRVVLTGSGFGQGVEIRVGGKRVAPGDLVLLSPVSMTFPTPPGEVGPADVEVIRGDNKVVLTAGYRYDPVLLDPQSGPITGGTLVTLTTRGIDLGKTPDVRLGGSPLTEVEVISASVLRARSPAHAQGPATLELIPSGGKTVQIDEAFTYYQSVDQGSGGLGGGAIDGTLTVAVLDWLTRRPLSNARVVLQKGRELQQAQVTDARGLTVFTVRDLKGPVTLTAGLVDFETSTLVKFDARDVTLFLYPIVPPNPGGLPPGQLVPLIEGHVLFGGATGAGLADWTLVPRPRDDEIRRVQVFVSNQSINHATPSADPAAVIDFTAGSNATAWPYSMWVRSGNLAVYALAGLYNTRTQAFRAYAMGLRRGLVAAAGDRLDVDVVIDTPLTERVDLELKNPPDGVQKHAAKLAISLGADGYILFSEHDRAGPGVPSSLAFARLPAFSHPALVDAFYALDVVLESSSEGGLPVSRATERLIPAQTKRIVIDDFLAAPRQLRPAARGLLQGNTLQFSYPSAAAPYDLAVTSIETPDQTPVWRVISPRGVTEVKLPDPATLGLPAWPQGPLVWLQWLARLDDYDHNQYSYRHLRSNRWARWSFDQFSIRVEP